MIKRSDPLWLVTKVTGQTSNLKEVTDDLDNVDFLPSNVQSSHQEALLYVFEDNEAVIKVIFKGRSPNNETCFQDPQSCAWLVLRSNQFGPKNSNQVHRHQKNNLPTCWPREISHVTNGIIFCVCSILVISVVQFVLKEWQQERKKIQGKKESQRSRGQWWASLQGLPQLCHLRRQKALGRIAMKVRAPGYASCRKNDRTEQPVVDCHKQFIESTYSASYSRWDDDKAWSSQEWKADKSMDDRSGQPVVTSWAKTHESQSSFSHEKTQHVILKRKNLMIERGNPLCTLKEKQGPAIHHWRRRNRIRIVIGIQIILEQGEWSSPEKTKRSSMKHTENDEKHSVIVVNVHVFNIGTSSIHGKELPEHLSIHCEHDRSHTQRNVRHIYEISVWTRWDLWSGNNRLGKPFMEVFVFDRWWKSYQSSTHNGLRIFRFCFMPWKDEREPTIKYCMGRQIGRGSKVHRNTETWTEVMVSQWNSSGIFSQDSPHCSSSTKSKSS